MHGLIFETSIWLLAGSTRYLAVQYGQTEAQSTKLWIRPRDADNPSRATDIPVTLLRCREPTSRSAEKNFSQTTKRPSRPSMINTRMSASNCRTENEVSHETKIQAEKIWNLLLSACAPSSLFTLSRGGSKLELSTAPQETQPLSSRRNAVRPPPAASL